MAIILTSSASIISCLNGVKTGGKYWLIDVCFLFVAGLAWPGEDVGAVGLEAAVAAVEVEPCLLDLSDVEAEEALVVEASSSLLLVFSWLCAHLCDLHSWVLCF